MQSFEDLKSLFNTIFQFILQIVASISYSIELKGCNPMMQLTDRPHSSYNTECFKTNKFVQYCPWIFRVETYGTHDRINHPSKWMAPKAPCIAVTQLLKIGAPIKRWCLLLCLVTRASKPVSLSSTRGESIGSASLLPLKMALTALIFSVSLSIWPSPATLHIMTIQHQRPVAVPFA